MSENYNDGLIQFLVIVVVAVLVLTLSGFSFRETLDKNTITSQINSVKSTAVRTYNNRLSRSVEKYIVHPSQIAWNHTRVYGVGAITHNIEAILNNELTDVEMLVYNVI